MLWSVLLKCTLAILKPEEHVWPWNNKMTVSQIRKPRSSLFKFGAQIPCYSGIINLNIIMTVHIYIRTKFAWEIVRLRNFLWTISVMCSYFVVPPACYKWLYRNNIYITIIITVHEKQNSTARKTKQQWKITKAYLCIYTARTKLYKWRYTL